MKNGFTAQQLQTIRTRPQGSEWYLAIHRPQTLDRFYFDNPTALTGSIVGEIPVHRIVSGSWAASRLAASYVKAGMTGVVWGLDSNSALTQRLGEIRIRRDWSGNDSVLYIAESGSGLINWGAASTVDVIDQYRPWIKHPRYDTDASQWRMDFDVAYDGQLNNWGPYANLGPPIVVLPTSSTEIFESGSFLQWVVDFYGNESLAIQNVLNSGTWVFPDGQTVSSAIGTSSAPVKITFTGASPGGSYFTFTAVDNTGASHLGRRLIFALNDISEVPRVAISDITGGIEQGGYQGRFLSTIGALPESTYPYLDNSELVVFERARYGASRASFGGNFGHRENVIFRGWVTQKDIRVGPFSSDMSLTAETIGGMLTDADSYDIFLANYQAGGSDWTEMQGLSLDGVAQFALKWRSTVGEICDWKNMGGLGTTETILYQSLPRGPFFDQLRENYGTRGVLGYFGADMQSNLFAYQDQNINGSSATLPRTNLENEDFRDDITITNPPRDTNAQTSLYAVTSDIPYGAESPAHVRGYFGGERVFERGLLVDSQDRLITWTGNYRAKLNSRFPRTTIPFAHNMRLDAVPQSVIRMSTAASDNARGITWTNKDFLTKELNVTYDATMGYPLWDLTVEEVVDGIGGSSITFPSVDDIVPIPTNPPDPGTIDFPVVPPVTDTFGTGFGTVYSLILDKLYRTRAFSASSPVWVDITPGGVTGLNDFILDPWSPATRGYLLGTDGVYRSEDLDTSSPSFTQVLSSAQIQTLVGAPTTVGSFYKIIGSINTQNWFAFAATYPRSGGGAINGGFVLIYTTNGGDSWSFSTISSVTFRDYTYGGALDIVPHIVGGAMVLFAAAHGGGAAGATNFRLYKSTNSGISWSELTAQALSGAITGGVLCHCPYNGNEDGYNVYWGMDIANSVNSIYYTDSSSTTAVAPATTTVEIMKRWNMESYTLDRLKMYDWHGGAFYTSDNAGTSWSSVSTTGLPSVNFLPMATGGFPNNSSQFYLLCTNGLSADAAVLVSTDRGATWTNKTGNLSISGAADRRSSVIVPLWTE